MPLKEALVFPAIPSMMVEKVTKSRVLLTYQSLRTPWLYDLLVLSAGMADSLTTYWVTTPWTGAGWPWVMALGTVAMGIGTVAAAWDGLPRRPSSPLPAPAVRPGSASGGAVWWFYLFTGLVLAVVYGFGVQMVFLMEDHIGLDSPALWGGVLIAIIATAAALSVVWSVARPGEANVTPTLAVATGLMIVALGLIVLRPPLVVLIAVSAAAGIGYGFMLTTTRQIAWTRSCSFSSASCATN